MGACRARRSRVAPPGGSSAEGQAPFPRAVAEGSPGPAPPRTYQRPGGTSLGGKGLLPFAASPSAHLLSFRSGRVRRSTSSPYAAARGVSGTALEGRVLYSIGGVSAGQRAIRQTDGRTRFRRERYARTGTGRGRCSPAAGGMRGRHGTGPRRSPASSPPFLPETDPTEEPRLRPAFSPRSEVESGLPRHCTLGGEGEVNVNFVPAD
ncbi:uncharacterized protein LOC102073150 isoform X4 [Zonotrichia albicollis]|uniref:uncharacterized protein LOC102073150 isoform X4 n=1 Tax=Zonotrichia albicollis TaxID=44394 RepID=UPI003D8121E8